MDKYLILFTMKGCPYCEELKTKLNEQNLEFIERDIHEYEEEYEMFTQITENEYVPAFMVIEDDEVKPNSRLYVPDRDFNSLDEGVEIIRKELLI